MQVQNIKPAIANSAKWYHCQELYQSPASIRFNPDQVQRLFQSDSVNSNGTQTYSSVKVLGLDWALEHLMTEQIYFPPSNDSQFSKLVFPHSTSIFEYSWTPSKIELQAIFSTYSAHI